MMVDEKVFQVHLKPFLKVMPAEKENRAKGRLIVRSIAPEHAGEIMWDCVKSHEMVSGNFLRAFCLMVIKETYSLLLSLLFNFYFLRIQGFL